MAGVERPRPWLRASLRRGVHEICSIRRHRKGEAALVWYVRGANPEPQEGPLVPTVYRKTATADVFFGAYEQLHEMEEHLRSDAAFGDDHAQLETYVSESGREVERRALQAHLDLRAAGECRVEVRGADGVRRTTYRQRSRRLLTV